MKDGLGWPLVKCTVSKCNLRRAMVTKYEGTKKGTLALGKSLGGTIGTMGASMGACGTNRIFASLDKGGGGRINAYRVGN
jgi:hypothetical protein